VGLIGCNGSEMLNIGNKSKYTYNKLWLYDPQKIKWFFGKIDDPSSSGIGIAFNPLFHYDRLYLTCGFKPDLSPSFSITSLHIDPN
jgi:hypothetical protein